MPYHESVRQLENMLTERNIGYDKMIHRPVHTSEEAAHVRGDYALSQGAKAIIVRVKIPRQEKKFTMLVIPGDKRFDISKVKSYFSAKDIRFASEDEVRQLTGGILSGGIPPFGSMFNLQTIVDPSLFDNEHIVFNAGDREVSISLSSKDYKAVERPVEVNII